MPALPSPRRARAQSSIQLLREKSLCGTRIDLPFVPISGLGMIWNTERIMTSSRLIQAAASERLHKAIADVRGKVQDSASALDFFHAHRATVSPDEGGDGRSRGKTMPTLTMPASATAERGRKLLENCPLFVALDAQGRRELVSHASPRNYAASEPICHIGEPGSNMMAVVAGTVRISLPVTRGREIILADLPAGELFGEIAMLDGKPRSANATALTKCELLVLDRRDVLPVLEKYPTACLKMMEILCGRIRRSDERMADIAFFDLPARLAKTLLHYPAKAATAGAPCKLSLSQRELAEMAGGTRENVNRCLRSWQQRGILQLKSGWTIILKPDVLRGMANDA
jgi:CRP/FNR family transcriptional regulator, cyclic AMP receptor protein